MKLHLIGVNGPYPASDGAASGYLLEAGDQLLQFDFGSGVLSRLTRLCPPERLNAIFLSHWHFDHTSDLLPLIYRLQALGAVMTVYAPADENSALRRIVSEAECFDLHTIAPGDAVTLGGTKITIGPARHPVPGVGFRVEAEGKVFGYTGDTNTLPELKDFYRGCGLLLADGLFPEENWSEGKPHLSAALAAKLAKDAEVKRLIITHLNPEFSPGILQREAWPIFSEAQLAEAGKAVSL